RRRSGRSSRARRVRRWGRPRSSGTRVGWGHAAPPFSKNGVMERRRNRVTPAGELIAVPDRGLFWGNRGVLHDDAGRLVRYSRGRAWAICLLEFKGRRRQQWAPRRLTELYFLD